MSKDHVEHSVREVSICSSLKDDVWHGLGGPNAFESWHFDAVSDDGREALVVSFYDNYPLSPRFHDVSKDPDVEGGKAQSSFQRFPAVSLVYSVAGKAVFDAVNEYSANEFNVNSYYLSYSVGDSRFQIAEAEYGAGFLITVEIRTARGRKIRAELEWLLVESDLIPAPEQRNAAVWNVVAPRADVSGKIMQIGRRGRVRKTVHFRGTGYHDQIASENIHYRNLDSRMWGRAHFVDSTVVFDRHGGADDPNAPGMFFLIRDGKIQALDAVCEAKEHKRDLLGLAVPRRVRFESGDLGTLLIKPVTTVRSGISEVKMLSEIELDLGDGKLRKTVGLTEFIDPRRMNSWLFRKLTDTTIGRRGRSPLF